MKIVTILAKDMAEQRNKNDMEHYERLVQLRQQVDIHPNVPEGSKKWLRDLITEFGGYPIDNVDRYDIAFLTQYDMQRVNDIHRMIHANQ
jgi:hypothetical protein